MNSTGTSDFQDGVTALRDGRMAEAEQAFKRVLAEDPDNAAALYNLGAIAFHGQRSGDAEKALDKAVALRPHHPDTLGLLAAVKADVGKLEGAVQAARSLIGIEAADAGALHIAGQVFATAGHHEDAVRAYTAALKQDSNYRPAAMALINLLIANTKFVDAAAVCERFLAHRPTDQDFHLKRAQALWDAGRTEHARDALRNLLDFSPDHVTAHYNLSLFAGSSDPDTPLDRLTVLLSENDLDPDDQIKAWFALGNLLAAKNDPEASLAAFTQGNKVRSDNAPPTHAHSTEAFEQRVKALAASPLPEVEAPVESSTPIPLIISGPSRSGKSLLQAWLSGHPDIAAADETGLLPALAEKNDSFDPDQSETVATAYRSSLLQLGGAARYVVDTHPVNSLYLDMLVRLCPDAKIIQMTRDPLDLAVSIYARHFVTGGHWADTWPGIAERLKTYDVLNAYWRNWPPVIATVAYEDLVADPRAVLSNLLEGLGLSWTDSVLPPAEEGSHSTLKPMPWASFADRPPVATDSAGLWKPFAPWLGAFAEAYGRTELRDHQLIPSETQIPKSDVVDGITQLSDGVNVPAVHRRRADQAERDGRMADAIQDRWRAVNVRPFTHYVRGDVEALNQTIKRSNDHAALSRLHEDVDGMWQAYRKSHAVRFGDFGLPYQSCPPALIAGSRDTDARLRTYDALSLAKNKRVLDLGSNLGFLSLALADGATQVTGVEKEAHLVAIARRVCEHLKVDNCAFETADVMAFDCAEPFDLVIAAALHGWIDAPITALADRLERLTAPGGMVLFESQGQRSTTRLEESYADDVAAIAAAGFTVEREGRLCDDRVNLRAFTLLRKAD